MISTVTTSTVSTITTAALAGSVALIAIFVLLILLVQKELASGAASSRLRVLSRVLNIGIVPLLIAFGLVAAARVAEVLR
jgi:hypothetical protein